MRSGSKSPRTARLFSMNHWFTLLGFAGLLSMLWLFPAHSQEPVQVVPPPAIDEPAGSADGTETAVLSGGCFWGVQGVFQHVKGVTRAVSGYAGGKELTAHYEMVSTGLTGHAESVQISYDPKQISYGQLLQIFFSVAHDPTELNRQGPDSGSQYRSAIFPANDMQQKVADSYIAQLNKAGIFQSPIVTRTDRLQGFYPAEAHHQDFLALNPDYPYIVYNDLPKVRNLKRLFPQRYREQPVLVMADSGTK
jgi:peptide-methionine (S)-S-oxide reductase